MAREERQWHPRFLKYMEMIATHPNYSGLPIEKKKDGSYKWIATAKSETGKARIAWCEAKARELDFVIQPGVYADVMLEIHPTKWKVCQTCGREMALNYCYPSVNFVKAIKSKFGVEFDTCTHISDIWDELHQSGFSNEKIASFLISSGGLSIDVSANKDEIIDALEYVCRKGNKNCLGPGAMSNFPDRYDGFHTYNRCCRSTQDKGRSKSNLKSYTKDRRAYEYWSDGNIHAANQFMGSSFFDGTSADHIGPISLGFIHDPRYLQPMPSGDNSSKRDRLQLVDVEKIIETEKRTHVYPMSWQSKLIWEHIKSNYQSNTNKISGIYRDALKQNMANFMYILKYIIDKCPSNGEEILVNAFLAPNFKCFEKTYEFNDLGEIVNEKPRHYTGRNDKEVERYVRVAIESVYEYAEKDNRNTKGYLTDLEQKELDDICELIESNNDVEKCKKRIVALVEKIEERLIRAM